MIDEYIDLGDANEEIEVVNEEIPEDSRAQMVKHCINYVLEKKDKHREGTGKLLFEFVKSGTITVQDLAEG